MANFCVNPLAAAGQFRKSKDVHIALMDIVECFEYLLPALKRGIHQIFYDQRIEERELIAGQHFNASLNALPVGEDDAKSAKRLWFIYTRNHSMQAEWEPESQIQLSKVGIAGTVGGSVSSQLLNNSSHWLSLGGFPLFQETSLTILPTGYTSFEVQNSSRLEHLKVLLPIYERSDKHKREAYYDASGDYVSPMTLSDDAAQSLLLISTPDADDRVAYHKINKKYYRFKITRLNIYHGFEIQSNEIPQNTLVTLR